MFRPNLFDRSKAYDHKNQQEQKNRKIEKYEYRPAKPENTKEAYAYTRYSDRADKLNKNFTYMTLEPSGTMWMGVI